MVGRGTPFKLDKPAAPLAPPQSDVARVGAAPAGAAPTPPPLLAPRTADAPRHDALSAPLARAVLARKKLAGAALTDASSVCLRMTRSPEKFYAARYGAASGKSLAARVETILTLKKIDHDGEDTQAIVDELTAYAVDHPASDFATVVAALDATAAQHNYATVIGALDWGGKSPPAIVFGPTLTTGFYDRILHVVTVDPVKNASADAKLDTLLFELQNALQRSAFGEAARQEDRGAMTAQVEYGSDKRYVEALLRVYGAANVGELVTALAIDAKYLVEADYDSCWAAGTVALPPRSEMPEQNKRQAVWWWKTRNWTEEQRKKMWVKENHGEGVASSEVLYA